MLKRFSKPALEMADVSTIPLIVLKFPASHRRHQRHDEKETARSKIRKLDVKAFLVLYRQENVIITFFGMSNFCNASNNAHFQNYRERNSDFYKNCDNTILNIYIYIYVSVAILHMCLLNKD